MLDKNVFFYVILLKFPSPNVSLQDNSGPPTNIVGIQGLFESYYLCGVVIRVHAQIPLFYSMFLKTCLN